MDERLIRKIKNQQYNDQLLYFSKRKTKDNHKYDLDVRRKADRLYIRAVGFKNDCMVYRDRQYNRRKKDE